MQKKRQKKDKEEEGNKNGSQLRNIEGESVRFIRKREVNEGKSRFVWEWVLEGKLWNTNTII